jgi:hypothetical protein
MTVVFKTEEAKRFLKRYISLWGSYNDVAVNPEVFIRNQKTLQHAKQKIIEASKHGKII